MVSKKLQSKSMCIDTAIKQLENVLLHSEKYRDESFTSSMDVEPILLTKCCVIRKNHLTRIISTHIFFPLILLVD